MRYGWLVVATSLVASFGVQAAAPLRPLTIGVEEQKYLPAYAYADGRYTGAAADIFTAFAKDNGYEITFKPLPIRRLYAEAFRGDVDLKFPDSPDWLPDLRVGRNVSYTVSIIHYVDGIMVRPAMKGAGLEAIKSLGTVQGFTLMPGLKARIDGGQCALKENPRLDQLLRQVILGRVDAAYASVAGAGYVLSHELDNPSALVFDPSLPHREGSYLMSSVSHPEVIAAYNEWASRNGPAIAAIIHKWDAEAGLGAQ